MDDYPGNQLWAICFASLEPKWFGAQWLIARYVAYTVKGADIPAPPLSPTVIQFGL